MQNIDPNFEKILKIKKKKKLIQQHLSSMKCLKCSAKIITQNAAKYLKILRKNFAGFDPP